MATDITAAVAAYANGDLTLDDLIERLVAAKVRKATPLASPVDDDLEIDGTWREADYAWDLAGLDYDDFLAVAEAVDARLGG